MSTLHIIDRQMVEDDSGDHNTCIVSFQGSSVVFIYCSDINIQQQWSKHNFYYWSCCDCYECCDCCGCSQGPLFYLAVGVRSLKQCSKQLCAQNTFSGVLGVINIVNVVCDLHSIDRLMAVLVAVLKTLLVLHTRIASFIIDVSVVFGLYLFLSLWIFNSSNQNTSFTIGCAETVTSVMTAVGVIRVPHCFPTEDVRCLKHWSKHIQEQNTFHVYGCYWRCEFCAWR